MKKLLLKMADKFNELKDTRSSMLGGFVTRPAAQQLEPVEQLAGFQHEFNETVCREIETLKQQIQELQGGVSHANS
ncbi:hypothetical protein [Vibrio vulnificus]|uniref:hypothetical protein n=1 Tax=Vibrio vulnificus TaxID=672 RepID=UPI00102C2BC9|nr:hypothetical protein [Vibrio vulnificus]RZR40875.1 hypothetical protein D8T58_21605 [Vibrio vulnificus]